MTRPALWLFLCPRCGSGTSLVGPLRNFECGFWGCGFRLACASAEAFGAENWEADTRPEYLFGGLSALGIRASERKRRLLWVAVGRSQFAWCQSEWFVRAIDLAERWADDDGVQAEAMSVRLLFRARGARVHSASFDAEMMSQQAINSTPPPYPRHSREDTRAAFADAVRELFPNPFVHLDWRPEWGSSTVRALAAHIYDARDFAQMPILADALQDAGCDDEQVLAHCRGVSGHARGCWVLDAILGRV